LPDDTTFGAGSIKGSLSSITSCEKSLLFITSADLRALPFETAFKQHLIRRAFKYTQVLLRVQFPSGVPHVRVLPPPQGRLNLADLSFRRAVESVQGFLGLSRMPPERPVFPFFVKRADFPLPSKFPFCKTADDGPPGSLYVFTYADFVQMGPVLMALMEREKSAYFMFIPGQFVKEAFVAMNAIFERQVQRVKFVESQSEEEELVKLHAVVARPWEFVPALQVTLIAALGCPIPIFVPAH
jgi:hypothetical protein